MAAPTKYSQEVVDAICAALETGAGPVASAKAGGITFQTYQDWNHNNIEFSERIKKARIDGEQRIRELGMQAIMKAGNGYVIDGENIRPQWQAWAWILERRFPDEYGRRERIDGKHEVDLTIKIVGDDTGADEPDD